MSEKIDDKTGTEEKTVKDSKPKVREADQIIEIRNTYSTVNKTGIEKKDVVPKDATTKDDSTKKEPVVKKEVPEKKDVKDAPLLTVAELQAQLKKEKKRTGELELIVEAEATKQFETEKTDFLTLITDEGERTKLADKIGDNPEVLNEYKRISSFLAIQLKNAGVKITGLPEKKDKDTPEEKTDTEEKIVPEKKTGAEEKTDTVDDADLDKPAPTSPAGKVGLKPKNSGVDVNSYKEYVDILYDIINNPEKTVKERKAADAEAGKLFANMLLGIKDSEATKRGHMPYLPAVGTCPRCQRQLTGDVKNCPTCGWTHYAKNFTPRR